MQTILKSLLAAALALLFVASAAYAHAFLEHAVPGVGATVRGSPSELELVFTEKIVQGFSSVIVSSAGGEKIAAGKPTLDPANPSALRVRLARALKPGAYVVAWHVVSVDTHTTSGTYKFTVAP